MAVGIFMVLLMVLIARFIVRIDVTNLKNLDPAIFGEKQKLTTDQKIPIIAFVAFIIVVVGSSFLPQGNFFEKITIFGQTVILAGILMVLYKEDKPYFNFNEVASRGISWDVIFMVAVIMPLAQFLCAENTGITPALAMILNPLMSLPPLAFIILSLAVATILTNVANNFVIALMIMPVIYTFATQIGMNATGAVMALFICTQIAIATPGASFPVGIVYSFSDIVETKTMMKYGWLSAIILMIATVLIAWPAANLLF